MNGNTFDGDAGVAALIAGIRSHSMLTTLNVDRVFSKCKFKTDEIGMLVAVSYETSPS